jgi:preprotein translocase subunit Sec61beta
MASDRPSAPASNAGIIRFYDDETSKVQLDPQLVVAGTVFLIVLVIAGRMMGL